MFVTPNVWMVVKAAKLSVVEDDKGVEHRMAECQLVMEEIPAGLAREIGEDVASHLFTADGAVRHELATITLDPRVPQQAVSARQVPDGPATALRIVEVLSMTFARQEDDKTGKEWIKLTAKVRFDLAPKVHREWLAMHFGYGLHFSFELEQMELSVGNIAESLIDELAKDPKDMDSEMARIAGRMATRRGSVTVSSGDRSVHITKERFGKIAEAARPGA